jgi:solute carrier family 25 phosphate transporter 3
MADQQSSILPSHLYRSSALSLLPRSAALGPAAAAPAALYDPFARFRPYTASKNVARSGVDTAAAAGGHFMVPAAVEPSKKIVMYSREFYTACTIGGMLSCGLTHTIVTPMDVVKCNMQIDPKKYTSIGQAFGLVMKEQGVKGLVKGWAPTLFGYSAQGAFKFGLYEFFKKYYADLAGEEIAHNYKTLIYLAGSASAEFFADMALCPFEAVKVRVQTKPGFANGLTDGFPKFIAAEGFGGYVGLPLCSFFLRSY